MASNRALVELLGKRVQRKRGFVHCQRFGELLFRFQAATSFDRSPKKLLVQPLARRRPPRRDGIVGKEWSWIVVAGARRKRVGVNPYDRGVETDSPRFEHERIIAS